MSVAFFNFTASLALAESPPCNLLSDYELTAQIEGRDAEPVTASNAPLDLPQDATGASCLTLRVGTCYYTDLSLQNDCNEPATWTCDGREPIITGPNSSDVFRSAEDDESPRAGDFSHD